MPTKVKGMTSLEIAIIVAIVLAIAVAAAWYLYSTFAATIGSSPILRVVSATAFTNGTIVVEVVNTGSSRIFIYGCYVFDRTFPVRGGSVYVGTNDHVRVYVDINQWIREGTIVQGRLLTGEGYSIPFSARTVPS